MLRVAVLSDALRHRNGVDTYYRDLVSHLRGRVAVAALLNPDAANGDRTEFFAMPLPGDRTQKVYFPHPRRLYQRLREIDPHVVISATPGPFGLAGVLAARWRGAGLIAGFHTHLERLAELYWNSAIGGINSRYLATSSRIQFRCARHAVVNSLDMVTQARRLGATRVELIGTPLPERFLNTPITPPRTQLRRVLYAGRLSPEKNLESVMEAAARLPGIRFSVAGAGPLGTSVAARAAELDNLHHMGWIPRERLLSALDDTDLLVLPSRIEAFGTVALEAMARGRLALVSPHCGILQWPGLDTCIFQVKPDEHLADAIDRIARLPEETRLQAAQNGLYQARAARAGHAAMVASFVSGSPVGAGIEPSRGAGIIARMRAPAAGTADGARDGFAAIVSVHDVMPETLPDVLDILKRLSRLNVPPPTLLIVPGKPWRADGLKTLAGLQQAGHELAGHGWSHAVNGISTLFHRLHSRLISRRAAEHLSRDSCAVRALITRCHRWFANAGLRAPALYVPPAWAMGRVPRAALQSLPFVRYELLSGVYDVRADRFDRLPLAGFEADSHARARSLRIWNAANLSLSRAARRPLRIAIHPYDLRLPLADDLEQLLKACGRFQDYRLQAHV